LSYPAEVTEETAEVMPPAEPQRDSKSTGAAAGKTDKVRV